jgi:peptidoglycan/LPS O-acetylase OafA/YrhL
LIRQFTPGINGVIGFAVLLVVLQSSGGFTVELLGPDILLAAIAFGLTMAMLDEPDGDVVPLRRWYRRQAALGTPLLIIVPAVVLAAMAMVGPYAQAGHTATEQLRAALPVDGLPDAELWDRIDPFGALWLIGLIALFGAAWPLLFQTGRRLVGNTGYGQLIAPILVLFAVLGCIMAPLRTLAGRATVAELTLGPHVRAGEWLVGAAAAAVVVACRNRMVPRWAGRAIAVGGGPLLVASGVLAAVWPMPWLVSGGPAVAALGSALLLVGASLHDPSLLDRHLGHGLPAELGRMAFPLLLLHYPVFWAIQLVVPDVRPFALLMIGGMLTWLAGLLLQDGVVKRLQARNEQLRRTLPAVLMVGVAIVTCTVAGERVAAAGQNLARNAPHPAVLVLGGSGAGELAEQLVHSRYTVVDGSLPGCGLLAAPSGIGRAAQTTDLGQAPATALDCGDWANRWRDQVAAVSPAAVIVALDDDSRPRPGLPSPCDPAFRTLYRPLLEKAISLWSAGDPTRPVLLVVPAELPAAGTTRCFEALLAEAAGTHGAVVPLEPLGSIPAAVTAALERTAPNG